MIGPVPCTWDGESFRPLPRFAKRCDGYFVVGETYSLVEHQERSHATHAHYFAMVNEAWRNLPEDQAERFPTAEHLRAWALIQAGFRDEETFVASSKAEASRIAAFIKPMDLYSVVIVKGNVVTRLKARSQSYRAMDRKMFADSKEKVLAILADLIGVNRETLSRNAGQAA